MAAQQFYKIDNGWPALEPGALRHPVTILRDGPTSPPSYDAAGPMREFSAFATAMAAIDAVRGLDVIKGGQTSAQLYLTVVMWFQPGILPSMRVQQANGSVYVIQSIENVLQMDVVLVLNCIGLGANE